MALVSMAVPATSAASSCREPYPDPRISLGSTAYRGSEGSYDFAGTLVINGCPLPDRHLTLMTRTGDGAFGAQQSARTDRHGRYRFDVELERSTEVMVVAAADRTQRGARSRVVRVAVSEAPPPDPVIYRGCWMPRPERADYRPPPGVSLRLLLPLPVVRAGDELNGLLVVHNESPAEFTFTEVYNTDRWTLLQNTRTGEVPTHLRYGYLGSGPYGETHTVPPGLVATLPVTIRTRTCQHQEPGPAIHPGSFAARAYLLLRVPAAAGATAQLWAAPAVPVQVV